MSKRHFLCLFIMLIFLAACQKPALENVIDYETWKNSKIELNDGTSQAAQDAINRHIANAAPDESGYIIVDNSGQELSLIEYLQLVDVAALESLPQPHLEIIRKELNIDNLASFSLEKQQALSTILDSETR